MFVGPIQKSVFVWSLGGSGLLSGPGTDVRKVVMEQEDGAKKMSLGSYGWIITVM